MELVVEIFKSHYQEVSMQLEFNRKPVSPPLDCKHTAVKCMLSQTHTLMFRERNLLQTLQVKKVQVVGWVGVTLEPTI